MEFTPINEIEKIHTELRSGFYSGKLRSIAYRKYQVLQLGYLFQDNAERIDAALTADLGRPSVENYLLEIVSCIGEAKKVYQSVDKWSKPEKPAFTFNFFAMRPVIRKEPKGGRPDHQPIQLSIMAYNRSSLRSPRCWNRYQALKNATAVSSLLTELMPKYLDRDLWDYILYSGSGRAGKIVSLAAAKHLTPITLELGAKSPVVVDPSCDLETAAPPDYILVPKDFQDTLANALKAAYDKFFPDTAKLSTSGAYSRLITPQAFSRVNKLLEGTKGTIVFGGEVDETTKYIQPTVVKDVQADDSLMSEEIFGPLLPIVPVKDIDEAITFINSRCDHPLALYLFATKLSKPRYLITLRVVPRLRMSVPFIPLWKVYPLVE
ncbi:aldehyde dehydrogenase family protein [Pleurotus pulmonarius]